MTPGYAYTVLEGAAIGGVLGIAAALLYLRWRADDADTPDQ